MVLFPFLQKTSEEKGIRVISIQGVEDHLHVLLQLNPAQNLSQVVRSLKHDAAVWLKDTNLLDSELEWQPEFAAYTVSPSGVKQVMDFIANQENYHKTKTLESELAVFDKNYIE